MMEPKTPIRKRALAARKAAKGIADEAAACARLKEALSPYAGRRLAGYMPIRTEIDPRPVMADWEGPVGVPVILGADLPLTFACWTPDAPMTEGAFGALIPKDPEPLVPEVLIVPLVAFTPEGHRLGYGGGFYDRTLAGLRARGQIFAVGFAFEAQCLASIPLETTDQPLDAVVTETGIRRR